MAKRASNQVSVWLHDGSTLQDMTAYVRTVNGITLNNRTEEAQAVNAEWLEKLFSGLKEGDNIELEGLYDDGASPAPDALFLGASGWWTTGAARAWELRWYSTTRKAAGNAIALTFNHGVVAGQLQRWKAVLELTGEVTNTVT